MRLEHDWLPVDLPDNVDLAADSYVHSAFAFLHYRSRRACGVRIGAKTWVNDAAFFHLGSQGTVSIGRHCLINGTGFATNSDITLGDFVFTSTEVFLIDRDAAIPPHDPHSEANPELSNAITIGDDCWVGMRTVILGGTTLGQGVTVGAGSVVRGDFPPYTIVAGNPARVVGSVDR